MAGSWRVNRPSHGFARVRRWTLDEEGFTDDRVRYVMDSERLTDGEVPWLDDEPEAHFRANIRRACR